jgi:HSP20 family protein
MLYVKVKNDVIGNNEVKQQIRRCDMSLIRWSPARELNRMHDDLNRLFSGFWPGAALETSFARGAWEPAVDISETPESYMVTAELPGLTKDDVNINYEDGILTIRGEKKQEKEEKRKRREKRRRSVIASIRLKTTLPGAGYLHSLIYYTPYPFFSLLENSFASFKTFV